MNNKKAIDLVLKTKEILEGLNDTVKENKLNWINLSNNKLGINIQRYFNTFKFMIVINSKLGFGAFSLTAPESSKDDYNSYEYKSYGIFIECSLTEIENLINDHIDNTIEVC